MWRLKVSLFILSGGLEEMALDEVLLGEVLSLSSVQKSLKANGFPKITKINSLSQKQSLFSQDNRISRKLRTFFPENQGF